MVSAPDYADRLVQAFVGGMKKIYPEASEYRRKFLSSVTKAIARLAPYCSNELERWIDMEEDDNYTIDSKIYPKSPEDAIDNWFECGDFATFAGMLQMLPSMVITIDRSSTPQNLKLVLHTGSREKEWDRPKEKIRNLVVIYHGLFGLKDLPEVQNNLEKFENLFGERYFEVDF